MLVNIGEHVATGCQENCTGCLLDKGNQNKVEIGRLISEIVSIFYNPANTKSIYTIGLFPPNITHNESCLLS